MPPNVMHRNQRHAERRADLGYRDLCRYRVDRVDNVIEGCKVKCVDVVGQNEIAACYYSELGVYVKQALCYNVYLVATYGALQRAELTVYIADADGVGAYSGSFCTAGATSATILAEM